MLSYAYGFAVARDAGVNSHRHIVAVIGDGSMTGGMAYEEQIVYDYAPQQMYPDAMAYDGGMYQPGQPPVPQQQMMPPYYQPYPAQQPQLELHRQGYPEARPRPSRAMKIVPPSAGQMPGASSPSASEATDS